MKLTLEQKAFLQKQGISELLVLDASGLRPGHYKKLLKDRKLKVAIGVTPCGKAGHTMRNAYGHCVQCNTQSIGYGKTYSETRFVYLAYSPGLSLIKIGASKNPAKRTQAFNTYRYGDRRDWVLVHAEKCTQSGRQEHAIHSLLVEYVSPIRHHKDGGGVTRETFNCAIELGLEAIDQVLFSQKRKPKGSGLDNYAAGSYRLSKKAGTLDDKVTIERSGSETAPKEISHQYRLKNTKERVVIPKNF